MECIEWDIKTEDSSDHWSHFDVRNKNVLDLGCGRWDVKELNEMTPFYFYNNGANKVLALDANMSEVQFFVENNPNKEKITFGHGLITKDETVKKLIHEHNIQAIKCDIEGSEVLFFNFTREDFKPITSFALEYHNHGIKEEFLKRYSDWGFKLKAHGNLWIDGLGVLFFEK